jgi:hypothetical protein
LPLGNEFKLYERKNTKRKGLVLGAEIEFRVGKNGKIGGMDFRWKSITKTGQVPIEDSELARGDTIEHGYDLIYLLDSETCPQSVLAPYFFSSHGHDGFLSPASKYSYNIHLSVAKDDLNQKFIVAYVDGGSGSFEFEWAGWDHSSVLEKGLRKIIPAASMHALDGSDGKTTISMISLEKGMSNILVRVKDLKTGVIRIKQDLFFSHHFRTSTNNIENASSVSSLTS